MRTSIRDFLVLAVAASVIGLTACGGDSSPVGPSAQPTPEPRGNAAIQGFVTVPGGVAAVAPHGDFSAKGNYGGIKVTVVGTSLSTTTEDDGYFEIKGIVAGTAVLKFTGPGVEATLTISGLLDGQVLTIHVQCASTVAEVLPPPKSLTFKGYIKSISGDGAWMKVDTREVTISKRTTIDKNGSPLKPTDLQVGWKVEVSGTVGEQNRVAAASVGVVSVDSGEDSGEFVGTISSVGSGSIVVSGRAFTTNGSTIWKNSSYTPIGYSDANFPVGRQVKIHYEGSWAKYVVQW